MRLVRRTSDNGCDLVLAIEVNQLVQSLFVGISVGLFLVAFGGLAVPASVQEGWIGHPVRVIASLEILGEGRTLSAELLFASALLGGMVALYFTGLSVTDATYRRDYFAGVLGQVEQIVAVRGAYLARVAPTTGGVGASAPNPSELPPAIVEGRRG